MRFTSNGLGLRRRTGVSRLGLIQGFLVFLVLLMVAAAGCGDAEPSATAEPGVPTPAPVSASAPAQTALAGHATWVLDSLDGRPLIEESIVTLKVDENRFGGFDGCNSYGGRSEDGRSIADADGMFSGLPLEKTAMGCVEPEGIMDQADAYTSALMQGEKFRVVGDRLEIFGRGGEARLVFVREAPLPGRPIDLGGTAWRLLTEGDRDGDLRAATLAFLDDRLATGVTACRAYLATYSKSEGSVRFPSKSMLRTPQSCPEQSRRLEGEYGDFLSWAREYAVNEAGGSSRLRIRSARGRTLTFEPLRPTVEDIADAELTLVVFIELRQLELGMWNPRSTSVIQGTEVTISFDKAGISGASGCNSYEGLAMVEDDGSITNDVQSFSHTEKVCDGPDGLMEQEERYLDLLPRLTRYGMYGDGLFMRTDDDEFLLFQAK